ncbi:hypothetical protein Dsin_024373 [Dipteronia sinensis]|uniref:Uncharacterized protein n=1 Tax=Dipteronia sinensis TaxID=43782 RepID=A0AAD9ZVC8_9ROSI|nr:hypothetical protein Dsin_024373 [Dipteronia sinensis]
MERKEQSNGNRDNKRNTTDSMTKIFGANKIELGLDDAFRLIGSVVEKGISDKQKSNSFSPTPPPKLTVLPFPVARHRSHGPHWSSVGIKKGKDGDNDDDEEEDDDIDGACAIAALAVKRKQKKGLDFSRWKELMPTDDSSESNTVEGSLGKTEKRRKDGEKIKAEDKSNISPGSALVDVDAFVPMEMDEQPNVFVDAVADMELDNSNQLLYPGKAKGRGTGTTPVKNSDNGVGRMSSDDFADLKSSATVSSSRSNDFGNEQGSTSLESEIDAENHARLQTMSPDEIAQAQAEIMEKMDPALLNLLKKRGQDKLKKQKCSSSVLPTDFDMGNAQKESPSIQDAKGAPQPQLKKDVSHSQSGQDNSDVQRSGQAGGFLWNAWSDRVEAVREIRFSLDGSVISHDFVPKLDSGDISAQNRLNADNVAERDFLRTDGDPCAAGYTIKEALALTRSTVCFIISSYRCYVNLVH